MFKICSVCYKLIYFFDVNLVFKLYYLRIDQDQHCLYYFYLNVLFFYVLDVMKKNQSDDILFLLENIQIQ